MIWAPVVQVGFGVPDSDIGCDANARSRQLDRHRRPPPGRHRAASAAGRVGDGGEMLQPRCGGLASRAWATSGRTPAACLGPAGCCARCQVPALAITRPGPHRLSARSIFSPSVVVGDSPAPRDHQDRRTLIDHGWLAVAPRCPGISPLNGVKYHRGRCGFFRRAATSADGGHTRVTWRLLPAASARVCPATRRSGFGRQRLVATRCRRPVKRRTKRTKTRCA